MSLRIISFKLSEMTTSLANSYYYFGLYTRCQLYTFHVLRVKGFQRP